MDIKTKISGSGQIHTTYWTNHVRLIHYTDIKSPASRLFTQPFIQTQIKENIKLHVTGLRDKWIPRTNDQ